MKTPIPPLPEPNEPRRPSFQPEIHRQPEVEEEAAPLDVSAIKKIGEHVPTVGQEGYQERKARITTEVFSGDTWESDPSSPDRVVNWLGYFITALVSFMIGSGITYIVIRQLNGGSTKNQMASPAAKAPTIPASTPGILPGDHSTASTEKIITNANEALNTLLFSKEQSDKLSVLRNTSENISLLERYRDELTRFSGLGFQLLPDITMHGDIASIPVKFDNGERRTLWVQSLNDFEVNIDLASFVGAGDVTFEQLETTPQPVPVKVRGYARILPKQEGNEDEPEILALRDPTWNRTIFAKLDSNSHFPAATLETLRHSQSYLPVLISLQTSLLPVKDTTLRVHKVHSQHWLDWIGSELMPSEFVTPDNEPATSKPGEKFRKPFHTIF